METLKDKMLKAIQGETFRSDVKAGHKEFAEACARVAEEEIGKVIDEAAEVADIHYPFSNNLNATVDKQSILQLKDKYLSGGTVASKEKTDFEKEHQCYADGCFNAKRIVDYEEQIAALQEEIQMLKQDRAEKIESIVFAKEECLNLQEEIRQLKNKQ